MLCLQLCVQKLMRLWAPCVFHIATKYFLLFQGQHTTQNCHPRLGRRDWSLNNVLLETMRGQTRQAPASSTCTAVSTVQVVAALAPEAFYTSAMFIFSSTDLCPRLYDHQQPRTISVRER